MKGSAFLSHELRQAAQKTWYVQADCVAGLDSIFQAHWFLFPNSEYSRVGTVMQGEY